MTAPTKVLFLDIDGVINSERTCFVSNGYPFSFDGTDMDKFDPVAIRLVRKLCEQSGASIVLSSTWRMHFSVSECAKGLDLPIVDKTPVLNGPRGLEINSWLAAHPEVTAYAIVDDNADMLPEQMARFVQTDFQEGLLLRDFHKLYELLCTPISFEEAA